MNLDIDAIRGDTINIKFEIVTNIDLNLESEEFQIAFSVKQFASAKEYVFQKDKTAVTKLDKNTFMLRISPNDTTNLVPGFYDYDLQITIYDDIHTIAIGRLQLIADITRPTTVLPMFPFPDIDGDGIITMHDYDLVNTAFINLSNGQPSGLTQAQENLADCNRNGYIDATDVSLIQLYVEQCELGSYLNNQNGWTAFMADNYGVGVG